MHYKVNIRLCHKFRSNSRLNSTMNTKMSRKKINSIRILNESPTFSKHFVEENFANSQTQTYRPEIAADFIQTNMST